MRNHPMWSNLIVSYIEKYQDAHQIIFLCLKLEVIWENSPFSNRKMAQKEDYR